MEFQDNLEMKLLKDFFKKRAEQNNVENFDPNRRELLGKIGKGVGVAAIASTVPQMLFSKNAHAAMDSTIKLPPGFANCRDSALKSLYIYFHKNYYDDYYNANSTDAAKWGMNFIGGQRPRAIWVNVKSDTPFKEPAYYFLAEEMDMSRGIPSFENIKKKNEPLAHFNASIQSYFTTWVRKRQDLSLAMENGFLRSIFTAAGRSENDVRGYLQMSIENRENFLNGVMEGLKNRSYDDKLCAAWSSFFLTSNYDSINRNSGLGDQMYKIEKKAKKILGHSIRGPPFYGLKKGI